MGFNATDPVAQSKDGRFAGLKRIAAVVRQRLAGRPRTAQGLAALLVLAAAITGFQVLKATKPEARPRPPQERQWNVAAIPAALADHRPMLVAFGEVVAGSTAELRPQVAGRVTAVGPSFRDGAIVAAGDLLVSIDRFEYEIAVTEARAKLAEAESRLSEAQAELEGERRVAGLVDRQVAIQSRDLARRKELLGRGAGTAKTVDDANLALTQGEQARAQRRQSVDRLGSRVVQAEATVDQARAALARAERNLAETELRAPFAGFLADTAAAPGKEVTVGDKLARLVDASRLDVRFSLPDADFARLLAETGSAAGLTGRKVTVRWRVGAESLAFSGKLDRVGAEMDPTSGGVTLYAQLDGSGPTLPIRPGAFVSVELEGRLYPQSLRLPVEAVAGDGTIYLIEADGGAAGVKRARPLKLAVLARTGGDVILAGDLPAGAQVVGRLFPEIGPGLKLQVR